jgi:type IV pilus biogenesis protein CpaD/CtpE
MKRKQRMLKMALCVVVAVGLGGCASMNQRRTFAKHVDEGAAPLVQGYRAYVTQDARLTDSEKKMRLGLADELEAYLKEGQQ